MATASDILTRMKIGCIYRVCDIAATIPGKPSPNKTEEVRRVMRLMVGGGLVEELPGDGYRRKKLYTTRQQCLPLDEGVTA